MPRGLAIETSGQIGSLALVDDERLVAEDQFPHGLRYAAQLVSRIDLLCRSAGWRPAELAEVYVSIGPGSFTGLRIGVTLAKTLAFATGAKLLAVPTVEVLSRNAPPGWQHAVIVLDARRDQIFTASCINIAGEPVQVEPGHLDTLDAMLLRSPRPVHLIGEGIPYHQKFIPPGPSIIVTPEDAWRPRAAEVARIGRQLSGQGRFSHPDELAPLYVRRPEAEEKFEERNPSPARTEGDQR